MSAGQRQEIGVGYLPGIEQARPVDDPLIEERRIVRPKLVAGKHMQNSHQLGNHRRRSRRVWIPLVADNAEHPVFSQWACGPRALSGCGEPVMRPVVLDVRWIDERDKNIHVEQK